MLDGSVFAEMSDITLPESKDTKQHVWSTWQQRKSELHRSNHSHHHKHFLMHRMFLSTIQLHIRISTFVHSGPQ
ncbi:hypothetical protein SEVIR_7G252901v4 [Setaria viridis]